MTSARIIAVANQKGGTGKTTQEKPASQTTATPSRQKPPAKPAAFKRGINRTG